MKKSRTSRRSVLRLVRLLAPYKVRFAGASGALLAGSAIGLVYPRLVRTAIDTGIASGSRAALDQTALIAMVLVVAQAALTWTRAFLMGWLGDRVVADVRGDVFDRLVTLPVGFHQDVRSGELTGRIAGDVAIIEGVVGSELSMALRNAVQLVAGTTILFLTNARLSLTMLAVVPALTVTVILFGRRIRGMSRAMQDELADSHGRVQEVVSAIATVQGFVREEHERRGYRESIGRAFDRAVSLARWRGSFLAVASSVGYVVIGLLVWLGGAAVIDGRMTAGQFSEFLLYTGMVAIALGSLTSLWAGLERAAGATDRIFEILDSKTSIVDPPAPVPLPSGRGAVDLVDVCFTYPARPDRPVLRGVSLHAAPGETVALVGPSGAGKTTVTMLLPRFYDPSSGSVRIDGVDVRTLRLAELRSVIAAVPQEPVLFSGTIAENIGYGREGATVEAIEAAARDANADEFIRGFPEGYATRVGERGLRLSGGQRQRIAIARALLADPRVLVLDEATSNLDSESEALVQTALERLMKGRTTLVVAHRLSTIRRADRICVVADGRIVEQGTHDQLIAKRGTYRRLVEHQVLLDVG